MNRLSVKMEEKQFRVEERKKQMERRKKADQSYHDWIAEKRATEKRQRLRTSKARKEESEQRSQVCVGFKIRYSWKRTLMAPISTNLYLNATRIQCYTCFVCGPVSKSNEYLLSLTCALLWFNFVVSGAIISLHVNYGPSVCTHLTYYGINCLYITLFCFFLEY